MADHKVSATPVLSEKDGTLVSCITAKDLRVRSSSSYSLINFSYYYDNNYKYNPIYEILLSSSPRNNSSTHSPPFGTFRLSSVLTLGIKNVSLSLPSTFPPKNSSRWTNFEIPTRARRTIKPAGRPIPSGKLSRGWLLSESTESSR